MSTRYENELERRLWEEGWATVRSAGSGTVNHASCDLVAIKDNKVLLIEVKSFRIENIPLDTSDDSDQLREMMERSTVPYEEGDVGVNNIKIEAIIALRQKAGDVWRYCDHTMREVKRPTDMPMLYETL